MFQNSHNTERPISELFEKKIIKFITDNVSVVPKSPLTTVGLVRERTVFKKVIPTTVYCI